MRDRTLIRESLTHSLDRAVRDVTRMERVVTPELAAKLDLTLASAFVDAQARVPVESDSLKNSGRFGSRLSDEGDEWVGLMAWGGPSVPHDVSYAVYAMSSKPENDWLRGADLYYAAMDEVIDQHLRRLTR